jgi:hypothetical protein
MTALELLQAMRPQGVVTLPSRTAVLDAIVVEIWWWQKYPVSRAVGGRN